MASKTQICSRACSLIGAGRVNDLDNPTTAQERECLLWWDQTVEEVLCEHDWKFARAYKENLAVSTSPSAEYDHAYELPKDCLMLRYLLDNGTGKPVTESEYELHGTAILSDLDEVGIVYTKDDAPVGQYPPFFVKALIFHLASYLAYNLASKAGKADQMDQEYRAALIMAIDKDQAQGNYPANDEDPWLEAAGFGTGATPGATVETNTGYIEVD